MNSGGLNSGSLAQPEPSSAKGSSSSINTQSDPGIFTTTYYEPSDRNKIPVGPLTPLSSDKLSVKHCATGLSQSPFTGRPEFRHFPGSRRRLPTSLGNGSRPQSGSGNAAKARVRGASGRLDSLGKGFLKPAGWAPKWYHSAALLRGGPAGRSAGELVNKPEGRDGLRDLPAGPGQPVQMPGMRSGVLFALREGTPEEPLLAGRTAAAGALPLPDR